MWSHYADCHRGFVIEIRTPFKGNAVDELRALDRLLPFRVSYSEVRPTVGLADQRNHEMVKKILLTKAIDWEYEQEESVVDQDRGPGIYPYSRDEVLWSVIAGLKCPEENRRELARQVEKVAATAHRSIGIYQARERPGTYKLEIPGHPTWGS